MPMPLCCLALDDPASDSVIVSIFAGGLGVGCAVCGADQNMIFEPLPSQYQKAFRWTRYIQHHQMIQEPQLQDLHLGLTSLRLASGLSVQSDKQRDTQANPSLLLRQPKAPNSGRILSSQQMLCQPGHLLQSLHV